MSRHAKHKQGKGPDRPAQAPKGWIPPPPKTPEAWARYLANGGGRVGDSNRMKARCRRARYYDEAHRNPDPAPVGGVVVRETRTQAKAARQLRARPDCTIRIDTGNVEYRMTKKGKARAGWDEGGGEGG